jgi:hypothetical protein
MSDTRGRVWPASVRWPSSHQARDPLWCGAGLDEANTGEGLGVRSLLLQGRGEGEQGRAVRGNNKGGGAPKRETRGRE